MLQNQQFIIHEEFNIPKIEHAFFYKNHVPEDGELRFVEQIHSNHVVFVDRGFTGTQADGMITNIKGISLCIRTADCAPILLSDTLGNVVGAIHAGWRGAVTGIIENAIKMMKQYTNHDIIAVIGPTIRQNNYEISVGFYDTFIRQEQENSHFFKNNYFDLPGYCTAQLIKNGVKKVLDCKIDTYASHNFASYRRATHHNSNSAKEPLSTKERQISMIKIL